MGSFCFVYPENYPQSLVKLEEYKNIQLLKVSVHLRSCEVNTHNGCIYTAVKETVHLSSFSKFPQILFVYFIAETL